MVHETDSGLVVDGPLPPLAIPTTLQGSLLARLDGLSTTREVAQIGAATGREFDHQLVAVVAGLPEAQLQAALSQLEAAGLVFRRGSPPEAVRHSAVIGGSENRIGAGACAKAFRTLRTTSRSFRRVLGIIPIANARWLLA